MTWLQRMYLFSAIGSCTGVFWPTLVKLFKMNQPVALENQPPSRRYVVYIVLGVVIGVVVAALTFATFLGSKENQDQLKAAGSIAYFTAFSAGFAAGSLFEEPLKA